MFRTRGRVTSRLAENRESRYGVAENGKWCLCLSSATNRLAATMTTASDTLPERNEEYATREYWYAPDGFLFISHHYGSLVSGTKDMHSESLPADLSTSEWIGRGHGRTKGNRGNVRLVQELQGCRTPPSRGPPRQVGAHPHARLRQLDALRRRASLLLHHCSDTPRTDRSDV